MMIVLTFILFFAFGLLLIWLFTRNKDSSSDSNASTFSFPLNAGPTNFGLTGKRTRIVFNGQEYSSPEEMPANVRQAYDQAMATVFADTDRDGVPDILEAGSSSTVFHTDVFARTLEDPADKLRKLKEMKDSGLITEQEYESKKTEILNRM